MDKKVTSLLANQGIAVNEKEAQQIAEQWESIERLKKSISEAKLAEDNIGLVNHPGGVNSNE